MGAPEIAGFDTSEFSAGKWTRPIYTRGSGPGVIVIHEMPNLHPPVLRFAERVAEAGMTAVCPSLFGKPGLVPTKAYTLMQMAAGVCIRREFNVWANGRSSPIVDWLRALARAVHAERGGRGVGAVGMCFTGGFALAMMTEPAVVAPVLSQPSLPLGKSGARLIDSSPAEIACAKRRFEEEDLSMIGLRFRSDTLVPDARFEMLKREFGDRFEAIELEDADARSGTGYSPHAVLTIHLDDRDGSATKAAEQRVIGFFRQRLGLDS